MLVFRFKFYTPIRNPWHAPAHTSSSTTHLVAKRIVVMNRMTVAIGNVTDAVLAEGGRSESVPAVAVDLRRDAAAESEWGKGVVVCEEDHGVD